MTPARTSEERTDRKAGYCTSCRAGSHTLCGAPDCTCSSGVAGHPNRYREPVAKVSPIKPQGPVADTPPQSRPQIGDTKPAKPKRGATVGLVREEPPTSGSWGPTPIEAVVAPLLAQISEAKDGSWFRILSYTGKTSGSTAAKRLKEKIANPWEFRGSRTEGGSAVYVRNTSFQASS